MIVHPHSKIRPNLAAKKVMEMQFEGKKGLIVGVANDHSIAWAIAQQILAGGGKCGFTHLPDRPDDEKKKNRRRVAKLTDQYEGAEFLLPMDANNDDDIRSVMEHTEKTFGKIDFLLHSIAFADRDDLGRETLHTSRKGFKIAMEASVFSLMAVTAAAEPILAPGGAVLTMTYYGGEKCVPGYNVMGVCKAALEASMRYLAFDMGARKVRVNALSAGPIRTLAGRAAGVEDMLQMYEHMAPLGRNVTHEEVGRTGAFLLSDDSTGITGEVLHVDGGYNAMGSPGRLLDEIKKSKSS
ncbi:Enoyl-[acyl-carrier-protein] reductase [NADH] FabI [Allorhodopirellula heiligendammensis]|uniref:Enoyl-[acyl-carrier-protein] reductase [NADH] n=2 Tax=Allorhodopirellula heiligendammensis TaxID=2714739 RepID=A0A5C6BHU4_9BACT|nr:Enoyl-[acyl-carrier-protein] reductase [NADH] FabI [Allorhodopirellula heiligendammensis]